MASFWKVGNCASYFDSIGSVKACDFKHANIDIHVVVDGCIMYPVVSGALYFSTVLVKLRLYTGF